MLEIKWEKLPKAVLEHLLERFREREVTHEDLLRLQRWKNTKPQAPPGKWWKDFGTFKLCGAGELPLTFLKPGQAAEGEEID